ncbi:hypothetical protein RF11_11290 [Thelohanellus kitauei]|uniref:Winged helix-turn helix domain-containing protein n=1 Tax=Thelohanellus kitauei TaxID=669202 RepID=A0A0C2M2C0_THEKT|nr:hypothetical protein RF11_11290 [Thelohanellus kitauei]
MKGTKEINQDLRKIIIKMVIHDGKSRRETAKTLGISRTAVNKIIKKYEESGDVEAGHRSGSQHTFISEELKQRIVQSLNDNTTTTIEGIKNTLQCPVSCVTVWRWVKDLGYTYKITRPVYQKRNDEASKSLRREYVRWYNSLNPTYRYRNLIYIDESPFNIHIFRTHSWAPKGHTPNTVVSP